MNVTPTYATRAAAEIVDRIEQSVGDFPGMNVGNVEDATRVSDDGFSTIDAATFMVDHQGGRYRVTVEEVE